MRCAKDQRNEVQLNPVAPMKRSGTGRNEVREGSAKRSAAKSCRAHLISEAGLICSVYKPHPAARIGYERGAVAQLGERSVRNAEVRGSIPLGSICHLSSVGRARHS